MTCIRSRDGSEDLIGFEFSNTNMSSLTYKNEEFETILPNTTHTNRKITSFTEIDSALPITVIVDCKGDKKGFIAQSDKYFNYFGVGKTKKEAIRAFIEMFMDEDDGEGLKNINFIIS